MNTPPQSTPGLAVRLALGVSLAWLWWQLINHLRIEWSVNAQYAYGWAVPFLCGYLLWRNAQALSAPGNEAGLAKTGFQFSVFSFQFLLWFAAILYLPTRLIQEANPDWRLVSWALALEVILITLCLFQLFRMSGCQHFKSSAFQRFSFSASVFPLCFFLVAVPWPTRLEFSLIQSLTRANAAATIELLNLFGVPALQRGNVIEISTGFVGIDDACSGIRSVQAALMIALFLGELYRLTVLRRVALVGAGFALAFIFNVGRTLLLVTVAAKQGVPAISRWHDPAGVTILVGCFLGLWLLGLWLAKRQNKKLKAEILKTETGKLQNETRPLSAFQPFSLSAFRSISVSVFCLAAWLLAVELGVAGWYRAHEKQLTAAVDWQLSTTDPAIEFKELPISENAQRILRYDSARNVAWSDANGSRWQMIYLRWNGGRIAAHLARNHTPEVCLSAAGHELQSVSAVKQLTIHGVALPFRLYTFQNDATPLFVFYCLREDRARDESFTTESLTFANRLAAGRAGRRNLGQRSLEIAIWGQPDAASAEAALRQQLEKIIEVKN